MYQNLALSPLIFEGLKNLNDRDYSKLLCNLLTERILCDEEKLMLQEYDENLIELDKFGQITPLKKTIIQTLALNGIIKFKKDTQIKKRKEFQYENYESEKKLLKDEKWRIILSHYVPEVLKVKFRIESNIEIAGVAEYTTPTDGSSIRAEEVIRKKPGQKFDFRNWILKYIRDAKEIIIKDGYICTNKAFSDCKFILRNTVREINVTIITLSDEARLKSRDPKNPKEDGVRVNEKLNELKNVFSFTNFSTQIINDKRLLDERSIDTDLWHINLGHSIGSVERDVVEREFEINVHRL